MKIFISILAACVALWASQTIQITAEQQSDLGVKVQMASKVENIFFGPYNGVVVLDKKDIISISSNIESVVKDIYVRDFQAVKKGDKLLSITSNELLRLQQEYIEALISSENIDESYERDLKLQAEGIISHKKLSLSQKEKQSSDLRLKLSANYLLASGLNSAMLERVKKSHMPIMQINFLAPKDGVISKIEVNVGEAISSQKNIMSMFANGKRFIEITVPIKTIENISLGDKCEFASYSATVTNIANLVNSNAQSVQVRAEIEDAADIMINRIYSVNIAKKVNNVVKIMKAALVFEDNKPYVFKKVASGFEVLSVKIISEGNVCYVIESDLKEGDKLAVSSTSALLGAMESGDE